MSLRRSLTGLAIIATMAILLTMCVPVHDAAGQAPSPSFELSTASQNIKVTRGTTGSFDIILKNTGTANITIDLNATGDAAGWVAIANKTVTLAPGANSTVKMNFKPDKFQKVGDYTLTIRALNKENASDVRTLDMTLDVALPKAGSVNGLLFFLALLPLIVVLLGMIVFKQSGTTMAFVGLGLCIVLAVTVFKTPLDVTLLASAYGFIKSFGISVAVIVTMYMVFLMGEMGLLKVISQAVKKIIVGKENMALFIGIGFGSFLTCLGVVTPALFPPVLLAMGFSPAAAVAISVLGYNATTSFALLAIPITLPAQTMGIDPLLFAYKVSIFLPVISVGIAITILWMVGGMKSVKKGFVASLVCGLSLALACLGFSYIDLAADTEIIPLSMIGVLAGLTSMGALLVYQKLFPPKPDEEDVKTGKTGKKDRKDKKEKAKDKDAKAEAKEPVYTRAEIVRALSPWIILSILAAIVSVPKVAGWLKKLPGNAEVVKIWVNKPIDLDVLTQIYFWIFISIILMIIVLRPSSKQLKGSFKTWCKRAWSPFLAYSIYFCIAYVMAFSAMKTVDGNLLPTGDFAKFNMNSLLGTTLAAIFGVGYIFVAAGLGLFGAVVGGSETGSNVMFFGIQQKACINTGLSSDGFMTVYGAHAAAGGVASAITPAKISNATATIGETSKLEAEIMRKHLAIAIALTVVIAIMTGIFVGLGI